jgi:hypothetical protein
MRASLTVSGIYMRARVRDWISVYLLGPLAGGVGDAALGSIPFVFGRRDSGAGEAEVRCEVILFAWRLALSLVERET